MKKLRMVHQQNLKYKIINNKTNQISKEEKKLNKTRNITIFKKK